MNWTLIIESTGRSGAENMSIDCSLLRRAQDGAAFFRLYRWSPGCLSFGRHEPAVRRYDAENIARLSLSTVRRPTGGRAVWHDAELTYAVAAPIGYFGSLRDSYEAIHATIAAAVRRLGVPAELAVRPGGRTAPLASGACFAAPVGGELVVNGDKLVGSAQVREGSALLQHGSLLLDDQQDVVTHVTRGPAPVPRATSLARCLGQRVSFATVADTLGREAESRWRGTWTRDDDADFGTEFPHFGDPAWTWQR